MKNEKIENEKFCDTKVDARDDVEDSAKHVGDGGDVGGDDGGDDYVIGGDGVAVVNYVQMIPFHMNMPALMGWEKGGSDTGKKVSRKSHPGKGARAIVEKEAKKSAIVVDKSSCTGKVPSSKKVVTVGAKDLPSLSPGKFLLPGGMQLPDDPNV